MNPSGSTTFELADDHPMVGRQRVSLMLSLLFLLSAAALLGVELDWLEREQEVVWLTILGLACCLPIIIAWLSGGFDPFEPVYPIAAATFIYYVIMVVVLLDRNAVRVQGIDYRNDMPKVLLLALLALVSFYTAYYIGRRRAGPVARRVEWNDGDRSYVHRLALVLLGLFGSLFILWIIVGRIPLRSLWIFGEASYQAWLSEAEGAWVGYLFAAQESLPACALLLIATRRGRHWPPHLILLVVAITVLFAGLGVRARILLMAGSATVLYYLQRQKRPSAWQIALMAFVVVYAIAGAVGIYRGPERASVGDSAPALTAAVEKFIESSDIASPTAVYVHWVPVFGYDWGKSFLNLLVTPIPSALWPDKYLFFGKSPIEAFRPSGAMAAIFVEFYSGFGPVGIVLGMALVGWLCRRVYDAYRANPHDPLMQITLALLWAYLFHIYGRNSVTLIVYGCIYVFTPVYVARWLLARRRRARATRARQGVFYAT